MSSGPKNVTTTTSNEPPAWLRGPLQQAANAATRGEDSWNIGAGRDLIGQQIRGDFLLPQSNPYLQQYFNQAADLTQNRLASEFGIAGRNLDASFPARSQELQHLSSGLFGSAYNTERDRQNQMLGQAIGFDPTNLMINRLGGLIPGAGGVTTSQQPVYHDRFGQFLGAGSMLGSAMLMAPGSDRRMKKNIRKIGQVNGHNWYSFEYLNGVKIGRAHV